MLARSPATISACEPHRGFIEAQLRNGTACGTSIRRGRGELCMRSHDSDDSTDAVRPQQQLQRGAQIT
jgi:hypothetical protein